MPCSRFLVKKFYFVLKMQEDDDGNVVASKDERLSTLRGRKSKDFQDGGAGGGADVCDGFGGKLFWFRW